MKYNKKQINVKGWNKIGLWHRMIVFGIGVLFFIQIIFSYKLTDQESTKIYDRNGVLLYDVRDEYRQINFNALEVVPTELKDILLQLEDHRFYKHLGISLRALSRAIRVKISEGKFQGASTIDQQVIKLSQQAFGQRTIRQKLKENILALNINLHYSKDEIFLYYINNIYFPNGVRGYATACQSYFQKTCSHLSQGELLFLYEKSKFPNQKSSSSYLRSLSQKLGFDNYQEEDFSNISQTTKFHITSEARQFVDYILKRYIASILYTGEEVEDGKNKIKTSFDLTLYHKIDGILNNFRSYLYSQDAKEACIVVIENGEILSMNMLSDYGEIDGSFINPCLSPRQVGSAIKPFVYLFSFAKLGRNADTKILDERVEFATEFGNYSPQNFDMKYHGEISLGTALGSSLNVPAVKVLHEVGLKDFYSFFQDIGSMTEGETKRDDQVEEIGLSLALGSKEISPLDFARMRDIFSESYCNEAIDKTENKRKYFCKTYEKEAQEIRTILSQNQNRLLGFSQHNRFDIPNSFAKSGTSRHFVDARICGGIKGKTICMRAGNLNMEQMKGGGHDVLGPIWYEVVGLVNDE